MMTFKSEKIYITYGAASMAQSFLQVPLLVEIEGETEGGHQLKRGYLAS